VIDHGGPTGATSSTFRWGIQYWTQRGFAVVDVDYGGSTGYGRAYRERLRGAWGIVDVEDFDPGGAPPRRPRRGRSETRRDPRGERRRLHDAGLR
jgi:hypothetical protein